MSELVRAEMEGCYPLRVPLTGIARTRSHLVRCPLSGCGRAAHAGDGLFILGLVGRAGSGKSAVARAIIADGGALIDADAIGHQVTDTRPRGAPCAGGRIWRGRVP